MQGNEKLKVKDYMEEICSYIKYKEAHDEVSLELSSHIDEIIDDYIEEGYQKEEALNKAIKRMGDPTEIGKRLNVVHKGTPDWITILATLVMVNIGIGLMYLMKANGVLGEHSDYFYNSIIYGGIGTGLIVLLYFFDYRKLEKYSRHIFYSTIIIFWIFMKIGELDGSPFLVMFGYVFGQLFAFIAVSPYIFIISLAGIFNNFDWNKKIKLLEALVLFILPILLMLSAPSLTSCMIYGVAYMVLTLRSGINLRYIIYIVGMNIAAGILIIGDSPHRIKRFSISFNPWVNPEGMEYINFQITKIMKTTGLLGKGFNSPCNFLPEVHKEFIFNYIIYSFGLLGACLLGLLIIGFILRILYITKTIRNNYGKLLIQGLASIVITEFLVNILMNINLMPIVGIDLPFISYNSLLCLANMIAIGLILSVYRRRTLSSLYIQDI